MNLVKIKFVLNGKAIEKNVDQSKRLLDLIRDDFGLTGTKEGCGAGECGACTVIVDGDAVCSCLILAGQIEGKEILTIEGVQKGDELSDLQKNFIKFGAIQCGFCTPGMIMSATAFLQKNPTPSEEEIKNAIAGNLCRCTGYKQIIQAIKATAENSKSNL
ncbi:MAG: (2Fe-2S)-binding protein [Candidatus Cloacimonetes bacterium]|nr:(2Fe-2S)-binding protein [Candidatus Cloacimonadota bacterium]MBL7108373.1 (2Fe-2S)-binding protein [Candidatus Cloacimonadota bacterium]